MNEWQITGQGDGSIQGFASPFSIDNGETVHLKVKTDAADYRIDVYRLGYYGGLGARRVATLTPSAALPQTQPACVNDATTGLVDCGNWADSATWDVPATAVSGVYVARLVRADTGGDSHVVFVVRDDDRHSDLLFQTSDTTWQAYNRYGGNSLYVGSPAARAYKVSYNRPITTRGHTNTSFLFNGEYPMIRWLERNGYDVSYFAGVDTAARAPELLEHETFLSVGHDEYWSGGQRTNVEAARNTGVNLAFFSGNEVFWKTRWEPSIDGSATPFTTLVSYKETAAGAKIDPSPEWTGTWRDPRFSPPADGGRPENALTGTIFTVNSYREDAIKVPAAFGALRLWRNTSIAQLAPGETATLPAGTLGHEWDEDRDNGFRPAGLMRLSSTTLAVDKYIQDYGSVYAPGTGTHSLTLYQAPSGALVFGAGTVQWAWGLDNMHDVFSSNPPRPADPRMQQATVNLLADMDAQPSTLQPELVPAVGSSDADVPSSAITSPSTGTAISHGTVVTITGTATDAGGGRVAGVEVSTDGGQSWHPAAGTASWAYSWTSDGFGQARIQSRAVDDSGNLETPAAGVTVDVTCPCSIWANADQPAVASSGDAAALEAGVKFTASVAGYVTGVRFFKGATNTGTHIGSLWSSNGTLLARATFTGESASGWQQVNFENPVAVSAGSTYVASYYAPNGHYALNLNYFTSAHSNGPLQALANSQSSNGIYRYAANPSFPDQTWQASNYWVDLVFTTNAPPDTTPPTITDVTPANASTGAETSTTVTATFNEALDPATVTNSTFQLRDSSSTLVPATISWDTLSRRATLTPTAALASNTTYTATIKGGSNGIADPTGNHLASDHTWSFATSSQASGFSLWPGTTQPALTASSDSGAVELGVKFTASVAGYVTGVRFFKGATNTGTHIGSLWSSNGTLLARATFTGESASGWQQVNFENPVAVSAGSTYVASYYAPNGHYALNLNYFTSAHSNGPLQALANSQSSNGIYRYAANPSFPDQTWQASNYWVDLVFTTNAPPDTTPPTITDVTPANASTGAETSTTVTATFNEALDPATVTNSTFQLRDSSSTLVPATISWDTLSRRATLTPTAALASNTTYTATIKGGSNGIADPTGNHLASDHTWSFATSSQASGFSLWPGTTQPALTASSDSGAVELGVKFTASVAGYVTGVRFFKGATNTGTHIGSLWSSNGTLLARATFTGESASGWQQVNFENPVAVSAGSTYVASYYAPNGHYALNLNYFTSAHSNGPLQALANSQSSNGIYRYAANPSFPDQTWQASNYWVDLVFTTNAPPDTTPPTITDVTPANASTGAETSTTVTATFNEALDPATVTNSTFQLRDSSSTLVPATISWDTLSRRATLTPTAALASNTTYTATIKGGSNGIADPTGNHLASDHTWSFTSKPCPCTMFSPGVAPAQLVASGPPVELGMKFQSDVAGTITGLRFYQGPGAASQPTVSLWTAAGALLGRAVAAESTGPGWRTALFASPIAIAANTVYVASYFSPQGNYAVNLSFFVLPFSKPPLRSADVSAGGNGVFKYAASPTFPTETWAASNYWVDVLFDPS